MARRDWSVAKSAAEWQRIKKVQSLDSIAL